MSDERNTEAPAFGTVSKIIECLDPLSVEDRQHIIATVATWFRMGIAPAIHENVPSSRVPKSQIIRLPPAEDEKFSNRPEISVKEFIFEKDPGSESERLACLAFYLTHYLDTPHFKTVDLSRLNTEAAQRKLSNPAVASGNAMRDGFFVQAPTSGSKQLSAMGERFVQLLPNREEAQKVKQRMTSRKRRVSSRSESKQTSLRDRDIEEGENG